MGCFVWGDKNGMGYFVRGNKNGMGCFVQGDKLMWDVLSRCQKWHGMFCHGMLCPTFSDSIILIRMCVDFLSVQNAVNNSGCKSTNGDAICFHIKVCFPS